jgi:hypothetical protein
MWHKKTLIIVAIITTVVIGGVLGGFAMASANDQNLVNGNATLVADPVSGNVSALLDKIATYYNQETGETLNTQALLNAFNSAQQDMRTEAQNNFIDKLQEQGKLTPEQAQQYKDWLAQRPDVPVGPGLGGGFMGKFRGMIGPGGKFGGMFRGWCGPGPGNPDNLGNPPTTTND